MVERIKTIPPEVRARFPEMVRRAIADGLSTERADRPRAERALREVYRLSGLDPSVPIIWVESPLVGALASAISQSVGQSVRQSIEQSIGQSVRQSVEQSVEQSVGQSVAQSVTQSVAQSVRQSVRQSVEQSVGQSVGLTVRQSVTQSVAQSVRQSVEESVRRGVRWHEWRGGQFWISWPTYIEAMMALGFEHPSLAALRAEAEVCRSAAYYWPNSKWIMICERPSLIRRDAQGRLHSLDGPSISWGPTFELYSWRGLTVPRDLIVDRRAATPADIMKIKNAEHRRAAIEIYAATHGPARFVSDLGATLISEDKSHRRPRRLYQLGAQRFVHVVNGSKEPDGSRREFMLGAPHDARTAAEAIAWSYGLAPATYKEVVRT